MTKDELGDIYQVVDNELNMGHGGERNGLIKKATNAEKDAFMKWKLRR